MRPSTIEEALAQMHNGQWFGWSDPFNKVYANLIIIDNSKSKPTENEINTKLTEIQAVYDKQISDSTSGKTKLKDLGLTDDEIKALLGA
jgi:hypothetical protein|tara:strand:+ start:128 stop:394 length:267 start_codon:yes stop_codon:yes gene_type:complete